MVNEIVEGVGAALLADFPEVKVWQNDISQGMKEPCFFIAVLNPTAERRVGRCTRWRVPLDVHYFPEHYGNNRELMEVADALFLALEAIPFADGKLRGTSRRFQVEDGVLHFMVTYEATVLEDTGIPFMETLDISQGTTER